MTIIGYGLRKRSEHKSLGKRGASDNPMQPVQNKKRNPTKEEPRVPTTIRQRGSHHEKPKNVDLNPKSFCVGCKGEVGKARTHRGMRVKDALTKLFLRKVRASSSASREANGNPKP